MTAETRRVEYESAEWRQLRDAGWQVELIYLPDDGGEVMALMQAPARAGRAPVGHATRIYEAGDAYWWSCACGDEGGPYEGYNAAWDGTVEHERRAAARSTRATVSEIAADLDALGPTGSAI